MPSRLEILETLRAYHKTWNSQETDYRLKDPLEDSQTANKFFEFVDADPGCFLRSNILGHLTGSALVVNPSLTKVLLTHHKKLGMWLQLGGHADGHHLIHEVAMTEAREESGLTNLSYLNYSADLFKNSAFSHPLPFDLDRHLIPANSRDPQHYHYDVRYLIVATSEALPVVSEESHDVRWFTFDEAHQVTSELSMRRQFSKVAWIKTRLKY